MLKMRFNPKKPVKSVGLFKHGSLCSVTLHHSSTRGFHKDLATKHPKALPHQNDETAALVFITVGFV